MLSALLADWLFGMLLIPFEVAWKVVSLPKRAAAGMGLATERGGGAGRLKEW